MNDGTVRVSVVVPTRNRLTYLREAVESVRSQDAAAWELIVVDDASDDGTTEWLSTVDDPRVSGIRLDSRSERSAARNAGLDLARGAFVLFLDDDDRLRPGALGTLASSLERNPGAVAAVGAVEAFDERGHRRRFRHPRRRTVRDVFDDVMFGWVGLPAATLFRVATLRRVDGWAADLTQGEDQDLALRLSRHGPTVLVPDVVVEHRRHTGQRRPPDTFEIENANRRTFLEGSETERRRRGERTLEARIRFRHGVMEWVERRPRAALRHFSGAVRLRPAIATSPVVGRRVRSLWFRCAVGALIGHRAIMVLYRLVWWVRRRTGRAPYSTASAIPESTGVPLAGEDDRSDDQP